VGLVSGYALANVDMVDITVRGRGGHGAYPHTTIDPVVLSSRLVLDFQTLVSRETSPLEPAVLTVGSIHGGTKGNVIPDEVKMELTLRSYTDEVRAALIENIRRVCRGVALSAGVPEADWPVVTVRDEFTPALRNDPALTERVEQTLRSALGADRVVAVSPVMGGEDFGRFGRTDPAVPICLFWLGAAAPARVKASLDGGAVLPSLHSPRFTPDYAPAIETGTEAFTAAALDLLSN
ncbi:MAG: M20/M25/M40 family metallo-hydrolase, partial [Catalinimonas sp.]